jgi:hypothetical protein
VAAVWLRSGVPLLQADPKRTTIQPHVIPEAALQVPVMCNPGTKEGVTVKDGRFAGVWPANEAFFKAMREKSALIGVAVDPLSSHECGNQRYLSIPWLDACLSLRLAEKASEPLRPIPAEKAWLAPLLGTEALPAKSFSGTKTEAVWLPNESVAKAWMQYVKDTGVSDSTPPPAPSHLRVDAHVLSWDAEADLESGISHFVIERDGQVIGQVPENPKNSFGRPLFQGLQYSDTPTQPLVKMTFTDPKPEPGKHHVYRIISVNTAGLRSKPNAP